MVAELITYLLSLGDSAYLFHEEGVFNYSTMLLREDLGLLVLGAREAVYALDLNDVSKKLASVTTPLLTMHFRLTLPRSSASLLSYQGFLGPGLRNV